MKNFGLTDKRYAQLQSIGYNDDDIQEIVEDGVLIRQTPAMAFLTSMVLVCFSWRRLTKSQLLNATLKLLRLQSPMG